MKGKGALVALHIHLVEPDQVRSVFSLLVFVQMIWQSSNLWLLSLSQSLFSFILIQLFLSFASAWNAYAVLFWAAQVDWFDQDVMLHFDDDRFSLHFLECSFFVNYVVERSHHHVYIR